MNTETNLPRSRILVVEDEGIVAAGLEEALGSLGYDVVGLAFDAREAVESAARERPDLVLMDIRLRGGSNGIDAATEIWRRYDIPVVFLSAFSDATTLEQARSAEPYGYLVKPFRPRELTATIEMALNRHRLEKRLTETERWLSATLRSIGDAVLATDVEGGVVFLNPAAEELTGWDRGALGRPLEEVVEILSEDHAPLDPIERIFDDQMVSSFGRPTILRRRDGTETLIVESVAPIQDDHGKVTGSVIVLHDVSEESRLQDQVRQLQKMESVGQLAAGIAHDFNNVLTVVRGHAELLLHEPDVRPSHSELLQAIVHASKRGSNLTRQLLAFTRSQPSSKRRRDLAELVRLSTSMLRRVLGEDIELEVSEASPEALFAEVDGSMIEMVLINLAANARDAMPEGGRLLVHLDRTLVEQPPERAASARPGEHVVLTVSDTGTGMTEATRERLFEAFFTTKEHGTGLGLATVLGVVEDHRGWIEIESALDQGTTFRIVLPLAGPGDAEERSTTAPAQAGPGRGEHVVLVEDDPAVRQLFTMELSRAGYDVSSFASGRQVLDSWVEIGPVDLLISDVVMPGGVSGPNLASNLSQRAPDLKVIFMSGYPRDSFDAIVQYPSVALLSKPFPLIELLSTVRTLLDAPPGEAAGTG